MTISALDVGQIADALVQIMRSDIPLEQAREIVAGVLPEDRPAVTQAFAARAWEDEGEPVPDRGARIRDWLASVVENPSGSVRARL
jgi:hypothetical protein